MITIKDLNYQVVDLAILKNINLTIQSGEKIALIGPSGAGKSSFLNVLSKRITEYQGQVHLNNQNIQAYHNLRLFADEVGIITQHFDMIENMSVRSNILAGQFKNWSLSQSLFKTLLQKEDITSVLQSINMAGQENKKVRFLSGGEKQRVSIARLLLQDPKIVLADEPIASLDPTLSESILSLLMDTTQNKTLVVSLHQKDFALKYFDRIIALKDGQIFFDSNSQSVTADMLEQLYERTS